MRTYGRRYGNQAPTLFSDLSFQNWAFDGLSVVSGIENPEGANDAYLVAPDNATSPVAFGPGIAIPQNASATYVLQTFPNGNAWVSFVVDYLGVSGAPMFSDTLSYNYSTGVYDTSLAPNGASLVVLQTSSAWYQITISLPAEFRAEVVGTQLEFWPVGISPAYVNLSASSLVYQVAYNTIPANWIEIDTDANGFNDNVYLTTLAQVLALNLGESPFYANFGIPQQQTVVTQVFPDFYAAQTQTQFAPYFASLIIKRVQGSYPPVYTVTAISHSGALLNQEIAL